MADFITWLVFSLDHFIPLEVTADLTLYNHPQGQVTRLHLGVDFFSTKKNTTKIPKLLATALVAGCSQVEQRVHFVSKQPGSVKVGHLILENEVIF